MYDAPVGVVAVKIARGEDGAVVEGDIAGVSGRDIGLFVSLRRHLEKVSRNIHAVSGSRSHA